MRKEKASTARWEVNIIPPYFLSFPTPICLFSRRERNGERPSERSVCSRTGMNVGVKVIEEDGEENWVS